MADELKASPENRYLAELSKALEWMAHPTVDGKEIKTRGLTIADLLPIESTGKVLGRLSRGEPLTTGAGGLGGTTRLQPDVRDFALDVAPFAGDVAKMAGKGVGALGKVAGEELNRRFLSGQMFPYGAPTANFVVKPKGGNWINNSVEKSLAGLKHPNAPQVSDLEWLQNHRAEKLAKGENVDAIDEAIRSTHKNSALENWIDKNLTNYVKKEMGTPEDPVRKLGEQNISHLPPTNIDYVNKLIPEDLALSRMNAGFPTEGMGKSNRAREWETLADNYIFSAPAGKYAKPLTESEMRRGYQSFVEDNPWLTKINPEVPVTYLKSPDEFTKDLGFDHIIDVLKEDLDNGRLRPESLKNVSMEQAVRRAHEYNEDKAKKMAEAQIKATEGMPVVKEYPSGHKWIELALPKKPKEVGLPKGYEVSEMDYGNGDIRYFAETPTTRSAAFKTREEAEADLNNSVKNLKGFRDSLHDPKDVQRLEDALKYEGDTMGHCVGGYCPDVISGESRIFSLRDAKGEPHVTIETEPNPNPYPVSGEAFAMLPQATKAQYGQYVREWRQRNPHIEDLTDEHTTQALKEAGVPPQPDRIVQIKGKQNRAPNEQYLPFVQDFVKSGNWSDVGDLQNTGLIEQHSLDRQIAKDQFGLDLPRFTTPQESKDYMGLDIDRYHKGANGLEIPESLLKYKIQPETTQPPVDLGTIGGSPDEAPKMKRGGKVRISDNPDVMQAEIMQRGFQSGGSVSKLLEKGISKFKYPLEEALAKAQANAALSIEKGGLGLPANNTAEDRAKAMGYIDYLHGTQRLDRLLENKTLNPKRATSGPMPFGTDKPELASSYATKKQDTSRIAQDTGNVQDYFQVTPKAMGQRGTVPISVERAWYRLPFETQQDIMNKAKRVGYQNPQEAEGPYVLHPEGVNGLPVSEDHWNWVLKNEAKGNPLTALRSIWHDSGTLYGNEEDMAKIFNLAGFPHEITQTNAPWTTAQGVLTGKARITNPLDTTDFENLRNNVLPYLKEQFKGDRSRTKSGPDEWGKNSRWTPKQWVNQLEEDLNQGNNSYVWTSIPDKVTNTLKEGFGYNGILDTGGKGGGEGHQVVIPFDSSQVRSSFAPFDPMEVDKPNLLKAKGGAVKTTVHHLDGEEVHIVERKR